MRTSALRPGASEQSYSRVPMANGNPQHAPQHAPSRYTPYAQDEEDVSSRPMTSPLFQSIPGTTGGMPGKLPAHSAHLRGGITGASELDMMLSTANDGIGNTEVLDPHVLAAATAHTSNQPAVASTAVFTPSMPPTCLLYTSPSPRD